MKKQKMIEVQNKPISLMNHHDEDYICLTDMAKHKSEDRTGVIIQNWLRNRNTVEFLGLWEQLNNPSFNVIGFDDIKSQVGLNTFTLSASEWIRETNSIGLISKAGRYGGTYAHKDIAFEFGTWISPVFKLYLIKEYQRLKSIETNQYSLEWNVKRILSKSNYHIHTDAVKNHILPVSELPKNKEWLAYADEADLLNLAMFGCTAKEWREANPERATLGENIRDMASINELAVLSNIESMNAEMIKDGIFKPARFEKITQVAAYQLKILDGKDFMKGLKKTSDDVFLLESRTNQQGDGHS
jgi:hypothetical protein